MTQLCVVIFVLALSIICLRVKAILKATLYYTNFFSPSNFKKNNDIILR